MTIHDFSTKVAKASQRRMAKWLARRMASVPQSHPIISFTFDDFPRSALQTGGAILERFGLSGTYYACLGLMKQMTPTGEIFHPEDLPRLLEHGHELGCHTFHHAPGWETSPADFEASVVRNAEALNQLLGKKFATHSYPISPPRPGTKRRVSKYFTCCRGGGQIHNIGRVDLNNLSAFFLEQSRDNPGAVRQAIDLNRQAGGWLIFATHDVCPDPTRFGCEPHFFEEVVRYAHESGARILPVAQALKVIENSNSG